MCNLTQLPLGSGWNPFNLKQWKSEYKGRVYNFDSEISKWCFDIEPERYAGHLNIIDRFLAGMIQPPSVEGCLSYMSLTPDVMGDDAYNYRWAQDYRDYAKAAE